jgi:hemolysin activation/secretion protein
MLGVARLLGRGGMLDSTRRPEGLSRSALWLSAAAVCILAGAAHAQAQAQTSSQTGALDARRVDINEYDVAGNTLLSVMEVQRAVYPFEGPGRTVADPEKARAALQKAYEARGYQAVSVVLPPQSVTGGVVRLEVVEARTAKVEVKGAKYVSSQEVLGGLTALQPGQSPNFKTLNSQLVALNTQSADLQVTPQLKPGAAPDTLDVELDVQDKSPLHGSLELNNSFSNDTTPLRVQGTLSYDDLWHAGHSVSAMFDLAPENPSDAQVYALTYSAPLPGTNIRLSLTGLVSDSNVATLGGTGVLGKGHSVTLNANAPLPAFGPFSQSLQLSVAYKDFTDQISQGSQVNTSPVAYWPISAGYTAGLRLPKDLISAAGTVTFAFRGVGSDAAAFDNKRYLAQGNFVYLHAQASWQHDLPFGAQTWLEADGQVSDMPLISNEQFSAGGQGSLRTPSLALYLDKKGALINDLKGLVFFDGADVQIEDPLPGQQRRWGLTSVGLGLRSQVLHQIHFDGDLGFPLQSLTPSRADEPMADFRLYTQF